MSYSTSFVLSTVAVVTGVLLIFFAYVLVVLWALRRRQGLNDRATAEDRAEDGGGGGKAMGKGGLSAVELGALPCHDIVKATAGVAGHGDCAVCLEAFEDGDRCRRLPRCSHSFHAACVDPWLKKSLCCPVCRADVVDRPKGELVRAYLPAQVTLETIVERLRRYNVHAGG